MLLLNMEEETNKSVVSTIVSLFKKGSVIVTICTIITNIIPGSIDNMVFNQFMSVVNLLAGNNYGCTNIKDVASPQIAKMLVENKGVIKNNQQFDQDVISSVEKIKIEAEIIDE